MPSKCHSHHISDLYQPQQHLQKRRQRQREHDKYYYCWVFVRLLLAVVVVISSVMILLNNIKSSYTIPMVNAMYIPSIPKYTFVASYQYHPSTRTTARLWRTLQSSSSSSPIILNARRSTGRSRTTMMTSMSTMSPTNTATTSSSRQHQELSPERHLVIVESPAKCATIEKILNDPSHAPWTNHNRHIHYTVTSCMGHIRNLPRSHPPTPKKSKATKDRVANDSTEVNGMDPPSSMSSLQFPYKIAGIDLESGQYKPTYMIDEKKRKVVRELQQLVWNADHVLIATDPDREGEAMAWHLADVLHLSPATETGTTTLSIPMNETPKKRKPPTSTSSVQPKQYHRIRFTEITKQAILSAVQSTFQPNTDTRNDEIDDESFQHTMTTNTTINENLVAAQETRRVLDRLAGYTVSPILWKKIAPGLSAGRVQSVGLQLIVSREKQRLSFQTTPYYDLTAILHPLTNIGTTTTPTTKSKSKLISRIISINGTTVATSGKDFATQGRTLTESAQHKYHLVSESDAQYWVDRMTSPQDVCTTEWTIHSIKSTKRVYKPPVPYKTSTLQQEAARRLGLPVQQTMRAAQQLYEAGCISYMRTDSTFLSKDAETAVEDAIRAQFGTEYIERFVPRKGPGKKDKFAQEAHEAIRPAIQADGKFFTPEELPPTVQQGPATQLYRMIYQRTQAYRMPPLITNQTQVTIRGVNGETEMLFRTSGRVVLSPGYTLAYQIEDNDDDNDENDTDGTNISSQILPPLVEGQVLDLDDLIPVGHETQPPPRYTEASFVKELEALGVGRPSTYAGIVQTLRDRAYIGNPASANADGGGYRRGSGKTWTGIAISAMRAAGGQDFVGNGSARGPLVPSLSAFVVCALLETYCPTYVDPHFTARMEGRLDEIASGGGEDNSLSADEQRIKYLNEFYAGETGLAAQIKRIDETVDASIARRAILPALSEGETGKDDADDQVGLFIGPWGPYVQKLTSENDSDTAEKPPTTSLPPSMAADISTIKMSTLKTLLTTKQEGGTLLGQHPVDGRNIRIKTGRYGVYLQWGDDKEEGTTTHTLPKKRVHMRHVETLNDEFDGDAAESLGSLFRISLDEAVAYCGLPRVVSTIEGKPIMAALGPYGPYLKYNEKFLRIKPEDADVLTIDAETAERLVLDGIINASPKASKSIIAVVGVMYGANVSIRKRKYGLFVEWKDNNAKLPAEFSENPKDITLEQAWSILEISRRKQLLSDISKLESDPESDAIHKIVMQKRQDQDFDSGTKKKSETKGKKSNDKSALSTRPKRPLTSYLHFCAAQRPLVAESVKSLGEISKKLASLWAETSEADREEYVKMAAESKLKYDELMCAWQEEFMKSQESDVVTSNKKASKSKSQIEDGVKITSTTESSNSVVPRAPSAYMLFCRDERPKIIDPETGMKLPFVETTQRLAALWRECDATVKEKYQQLASIEKGKLQQQHSNAISTK